MGTGFGKGRKIAPSYSIRFQSLFYSCAVSQVSSALHRHVETRFLQELAGNMLEYKGINKIRMREEK